MPDLLMITIHRCRGAAILAGFILLAGVSVAQAEDAAELKKQGIDALRASTDDPHAIVDAARYFVKAIAQYEASGTEAQIVEVNSYLYWCKKKMTLANIEEFTQQEGAERSKKLEHVVTRAVPKTEAKTSLQRAEAFASGNPTEHLLIAIHYFEVADRFKGTDEGMLALDRSLKEMQKSERKTAAAPARQYVPEQKDEHTARLVPAANRQQEAELILRNSLKELYASAKPEDKQELLRRLHELARGSPDGSTDKYVALREICEQAVLAGNYSTAIETSSVLGHSFGVDDGAVVNLLKKVNALFKTNDQICYAAALSALEAAEILAQAEQYDKAKLIVSAIQSVLSRLVNRATARALKERLDILGQASTEWPAVQPILAKLKTVPDDAALNLAIGKFYCLTAANWKRGVMFLANGNDEAMSTAAKKELAAPASADDQAAVGDAWWETMKGMAPFAKRIVSLHAAEWYERALSESSSLNKLKLSKRLKEIHDGDPPPLLPPLTLLSVKWGSGDRKIDITSYCQKEMETNPYFAFFGTTEFPDPVPGGHKTLSVQTLADGKLDSFEVDEWTVRAPLCFDKGVPIGRKEYRILKALVTAPRKWWDKTEYAIQFAKSPETSVDIPKIWEMPNRVDPWPNVHKKLIVWFEFEGKLYARTYGDGDNCPIRP